MDLPLAIYFDLFSFAFHLFALDQPFDLEHSTSSTLFFSYCHLALKSQPKCRAPHKFQKPSP